jgi:hypothetical protein
MVYHLKFENWQWPCFSICKKKKDSFDCDNQIEKGPNSSNEIVPQNDTSERTDNKKEAPYSIKADFAMPPTRISVNTAMSLSEKLQNGSVLTNKRIFLFLAYRKAWPLPIFKFKMIDHHNGRKKYNNRKIIVEY